jgi:hypothetical protein
MFMISWMNVPALIAVMTLRTPDANRMVTDLR